MTSTAEPRSPAGAVEIAATAGALDRTAPPLVGAAQVDLTLDALNHGWRPMQTAPVGVLAHDTLHAEWMPLLGLLFVDGRLLAEAPANLDEATRTAARKLMDLDAYREARAAYEQHEREWLSQCAARSPVRVEDRARAYLRRLPPSIAHARGAAALFTAASVCVRGFGLGIETALVLMREYDQHSAPPWGDRELVRVLRSAKRNGRMPIGRLL